MTNNCAFSAKYCFFHIDIEKGRKRRIDPGFSLFFVGNAYVSTEFCKYYVFICPYVFSLCHLSIFISMAQPPLTCDGLAPIDMPCLLQKSTKTAHGIERPAACVTYPTPPCPENIQTHLRRKKERGSFFWMNIVNSVCMHCNEAIIYNQMARSFVVRISYTKIKHHILEGYFQPYCLERLSPNPNLVVLMPAARMPILN